MLEPYCFVPNLSLDLLSYLFKMTFWASLQQGLPGSRDFPTALPALYLLLSPLVALEGDAAEAADTHIILLARTYPR